MVPVLPVPVHEVGRRSISVEWTMFGWTIMFGVLATDETWRRGKVRPDGRRSRRRSLAATP